MCNTYFLLCSKLSTGKTQVSHELSIDKTAKSYHLHRIFLASLPHILPTLRTQDVQQVVISHLNNIYINIYDKVEKAPVEKPRSSTLKQKWVPLWVISNGKWSMTWCKNRAAPCHCCVAIENKGASWDTYLADYTGRHCLNFLQNSWHLF